MAKHEIESEVAGNVWKLTVAVGDQVKVGDVIMILESMKMEIPVESSVTGKVISILVEPETAVAEDQVLAVVED